MRTTRHPFNNHTNSTALIYGGTFDPPTIAHEILPAKAAAHINAKLIIYIPAARSPFKPNPPIASDHHRTAMLEALDPSQHANVDAVIYPIELDTLKPRNAVPSFTVDTLLQLRAQAPPAVTLRLLIGEDQARSFHNWQAPETILNTAPPVVITRPTAADDSGSNPDDLLNHLANHWSPRDLDRWKHAIVPLNPLPVSATHARDILASKGPSAPELTHHLTALVIDYITRHNLYQAQ